MRYYILSVLIMLCASCGDDGSDEVAVVAGSDAVADSMMPVDDTSASDTLNGLDDGQTTEDVASPNDTGEKEDAAAISDIASIDIELVDAQDAADGEPPPVDSDSSEDIQDVETDTSLVDASTPDDITFDTETTSLITLPEALEAGFIQSGAIMEVILGAQAVPQFPSDELHTVRWLDAIDLTMSDLDFASLADGAPYVARIRAGLLVTEPGVYDIALAGRGGAFLTLHSEPIIDMWGNTELTTQTAQVQLDAGYYPLEILYNRTEPKAHLQLWWGQGATLEVIPPTQYALQDSVPAGIPELVSELELLSAGYSNASLLLKTTVPVEGTVIATTADSEESLTVPIEAFTADGSPLFVPLPAGVTWSVVANVTDPWGRTASNDPIEIQTLEVPSYTAGGLLGTYYQGGDYKNFEIPVATRLDPVVNHPTILDGNTNGSFLMPMSPDQFGVQWLGGLYVPETDVYTLHYGTDDGQRLWVDGEMLAQAWYGHGILYVSATVLLAEGWHPLQLDLYESGGGGGANFEWESSTIARQVVPAENLGYVAPRVPTTAPEINWLTATYEASDQEKVEAFTNTLSTCTLTITHGESVSEAIRQVPRLGFSGGYQIWRLALRVLPPRLRMPLGRRWIQ